MELEIPYLRGDPMSEAGGVGLLPALCLRRTAWRLNVLRSRRNVTVSSLVCAAAARQILQVNFFLNKRTGNLAISRLPLNYHLL